MSQVIEKIIMNKNEIALKVIKNAGIVEEYDQEKILRTIGWAIDGLQIEASPLISALNSRFEQSDQVYSDEIAKALINTAIHLTSMEEPDWRFVAGRLKMLNIYKEINRLRGIDSLSYSSYHSVARNLVDRGIYVKELFEVYSDAEIKEAGTFINPEYDWALDYAGVNLMYSRYLVQVGKDIVELPQEMFLTIALLLCQNEKPFERMERVRTTYKMLADRKISLATPILLNLRRPGGNLSSCFIVSADDYLESIYYVVETCAKISKQGGGIATDWSRVRAKGSWIKEIPNCSGGVLPWLKVINDTAVAVNQQGKRAGSITVALDIWHLDLEDFLELQTENGDQRRKAFDVFPQVVVTDEFMRRVDENKEWFMFDPYEIKHKFGYNLAELWGAEFTKIYQELEEKIYTLGEKHGVDLKKLNGTEFKQAYADIIKKDSNSTVCIELVNKSDARNIVKHIMKTQLETGLPYIAFKDAINQQNPNKGSGYIPCVNLCVESYSNVKPAKVFRTELKEGQTIRVTEGGENHTCNLLSLNLANLLNEDDLEEATRESVRILDNTIDFTEPPVPESKIHNNNYRTIGIGVMGYADYASYYKIPYNKSSGLADRLFDSIAYFAFDESANLAKERGVFDSYESSDFAKGMILSHNKDWFKEHSQQPNRWMNLFDKIKSNGIRNSQLLAIAPNTSTALLQGATASILPVFSKFFIDDNGKGSIPIMPPFLKDRLWFYQEFKNIDQKDVISVIGKAQKWIDTGISMELLFNLNNENIDAKYIYDSIMYAWKQRCKAIYYIRSVQKDGSTSSKDECISCAG